MADVSGSSVKVNTVVWCVAGMLPISTGTIGLAGKIIIKDSTVVSSLMSGFIAVFAGLPNNETGSFSIVPKAGWDMCPPAVETGVSYAGETMCSIMTVFLDTVAASKAGRVYSGEPGLAECTV